MRYLLDTNVISEWTRPRPGPAVAAWLDAAEEDMLYLSVVAFAEIRLGIELLPEGRNRSRITAWLARDLALASTDGSSASSKTSPQPGP